MALSLWAPHVWAKDPPAANEAQTTIPPSASEAQGAEETFTDDEMAVRNEGAHRFLLPKDWPVERRDGHVSPVNVETYLSMKFGQFKRKFGETDQRFDELERRIAELEQSNKQLLKWMRLMEERAQVAQQEKEVTHGESTKVPEAESPEAPNAP